MAFVVVCFEKTNKKKVVPISWLKDGQCVWPPKKLQKRVLPLIYTSFPPCPTWMKYSVDILKVCDDYNEAQKVLKKCKVTSDLTSDPDKRGRGQRLKFKKTYTSSSAMSGGSGNETDLEDVPNYQPEHPQPLVPLVINLKRQSSESLIANGLTAGEGDEEDDNNRQDYKMTEDLDYIESTYVESTNLGLTAVEHDIANPSGDKDKEDDMSSDNEDDMSEHSESLITSPGSSRGGKRISLGGSLQKPPKKRTSLRGVDKAVIKELLLLKANLTVVQENQEVMKKLLLAVISSSQAEKATACVDQDSSWMQRLPLVHKEELLKMEEELGNEDLFKNFVQMLMKVGGATPDAFIKFMMRKTIHDSLATTFSFLGIRGKAAFKNHKICKAIKCAVRTHPLFKDTLEMDVERTIQNWLRHASSRTQKLKKYKMAKEQ